MRQLPQEKWSAIFGDGWRVHPLHHTIRIAATIKIFERNMQRAKQNEARGQPTFEKTAETSPHRLDSWGSLWQNV